MKQFAATLMACSCVLMFCLPPAMAEEAASAPMDCNGYRGDVSHELELLGQPATSLNAGRNAKTTAHVDLDKHYAVKLVPQSSVKFAAKVGKPAVEGGGQGGLLAFRTGKAGRYRVAITTSHWVDVVDGRNLVVSLDFQGQRNCAKLRKVVELELTGNREFVLQLSGGADENVGLAVTQVKSGS